MSSSKVGGGILTFLYLTPPKLKSCKEKAGWLSIHIITHVLTDSSLCNIHFVIIMTKEKTVY